MKRRVLSGVLALALAPAAFGYVNDTMVDYPLFSPASDIQIDDPIFVNNSFFRVVLPGFSGFSGSLYETKNTLNYTNRGILIGSPGFEFKYFQNPAPESAPIGQSYESLLTAANFVNEPEGIIQCNGFFFTNVLAAADFFLFGIGGNSKFIVSATNLVQSGLLTLDNSGLIRLNGQNVDLSRGIFSMPGVTSFSNSSLGVTVADYGIGTNTNFWDPSIFLGPTFAVSPVFNTFLFPAAQFFFGRQMVLTNSQAFFFIVPDGPSNFITRAIFLQDESAANVAKNVYFGGFGVGAGAGHVEWAGNYIDPLTGQPATNYFYLSDLFIRVLNAQLGFNNVPDNYTFAQNRTPLILGPPAVEGFVPVFPPGAVTNEYTYVNVNIIPTLTPTNTVAGANMTNILGRFEVSASGHLNLDHAQILGPSYISIKAPRQFDGNQGARIEAPFADLNLGVTNGFLVLSNLLVPRLPVWSGSIEAWTTVWVEVDPLTGATNDFRIALVHSAGMSPTTPVLVKDLILHAANSVTFSDSINVGHTVLIDSPRVTFTTNGPGAMSPVGELNLIGGILWSPAFPNLLYLTNDGNITAPNLVNFAGNMTSPLSPRSQATPYQTFVNHGNITNQGTFILAKYVENTGVIQENIFGDLAMQANCAVLLGGTFSAPLGRINLECNNLTVSNHFLAAGLALTLSPTNCLYDGNTFSNQFAHMFTSNSPALGIVTNGNLWVAGAGFNLLVKPATGDLLGTTVTNSAPQDHNVVSRWAGQDRLRSPNGYANNAAVGRLILDGANNSLFTFLGTGGANALYVDHLDLRNYATNRNASGDMIAIAIANNMRIYYAEATADGVPISEKIDGKNGGRFLWVSNYAGIYSATNLLYPDGNLYTFNRPLVESPLIDSDGDGIVNRDDPTPILTNQVFDVAVAFEPCTCTISTGDPVPAGPAEFGAPEGGSSEANITKLAMPAPTFAPAGAAVSFNAAKGSYHGLFYDTNNAGPDRSGYFSGTTTASGRFTAKLLLGGRPYPFSGQFDNSGDSTNSVPGKNLGSLDVDLHLNSDDGEITGHVSRNGWSAELLAHRIGFDSAHPTGLAGKYTLLVSGDGEGDTSPGGDGPGTVTVDTKGNVTWSAFLADGSKVTQKSALSQEGLWPLYSAVYGGKGSIFGWVQFTNRAADDLHGELLWLAPAGAPGGLYSGGFSNKVTAIGSQNSGTGLAESTNSWTILSGGSLDSAITNQITINSAGKVISGPDSGLTLSINRTTGLFKGGLFDDTGHRLNFQGALLQKQGIGSGFFLDSNLSGRVFLGPASP